MKKKCVCCGDKKEVDAFPRFRGKVGSICLECFEDADMRPAQDK